MNEPKKEAGADLQQIAATLLSPSVPNNGDNASSDKAPKPSDLQQSASDEDDLLEDAEPDAEDTSDDMSDDFDADDFDEPENDAEDDEEPAEAEEYLDIQDDDLITVMVDGEKQEVTISDLKAAYAGEGAIQKRLQEATEARKHYLSLNRQLSEKLFADEQIAASALASLDETTFKPLVSKPLASLRQTDPGRYLKHLEAYEADQQRIAHAKEAVQTKIKELQDQRTQRLNQYAMEAGRVIAQAIPELAHNDERVRQEYFGRLARTALSYGYSQQEIESAIDPRMYVLVRDAMKYQELQGKAKEVPDVRDLSKQKQKKVRRLRSGGAKAKAAANASAKQKQALKERARSTGSVTDVAKLLING